MPGVAGDLAGQGRSRGCDGGDAVLSDAATNRCLIDLEKPDVRGALDLSAADFFQPWREADVPTRLQRLGLAVSKQRDVSAIRYPSDACRRAGTKGWNVVIFPEAVVAPDRVRILGRSGAALEELS